MTESSVSSRVRWIHEEKVDDAITFRAGKSGTHMVADWPGFATLTCARDGSAATLVRAEGVTDREIGKLRRGQVRALLGDLGGRLALHGSAVALGGRAVLFVGCDGAGKSTAAAEMCLRHDAVLFADDAALLDVTPGAISILPGEADHWLTPDSCDALGLHAERGAEAASAKRNLRASRVAQSPCPLQLVVALRFVEGPPEAALGPSGLLRRLTGGDAARALLEATIRFDVEDGAARRREFEQITTVYERTAFVEIQRPRSRPAGVADHVLHVLEREGR